MKSQPVFAFLLTCAAMVPAIAQSQNPTPQSTAPIVYKNTQYGFCFRLPADWKGYTIVTEKWSGTRMDSENKENGPQLLIRNPKWTQDDPWQDIPIMIFTLAQWKLAEADNLTVSAAPIGPAKLGSNKNYVFALPPRSIGFTDAMGQDEVQTLIDQHSLEAPCGHKSTEPIENLP